MIITYNEAIAFDEYIEWNNFYNRLDTKGRPSGATNITQQDWEAFILYVSRFEFNVDSIIYLEHEIADVYENLVEFKLDNKKATKITVLLNNKAENLKLWQGEEASHLFTVVIPLSATPDDIYPIKLNSKLMRYKESYVKKFLNADEIASMPQSWVNKVIGGDVWE